MEAEIKLEDLSIDSSKQIKDCLIYNAIQLNEHLSTELSDLQNEEKSKITARVIDLAVSTAIISDLAFSKLSDTNTVIQNRVSH